MRYANTGFSLEIDLTRGSIDRTATDPKSVELYLAGQGTAAKMLWDRVPPEVEPFSPNNLLIFSAGLLDATPVPGANRTSVSTISPQSNLYVNSGLGGFFGPELKQAGYKDIVIRGKSDGLVYLWIHNDKVEIRDAGHLQGKSALETTALIRQELKDPNIQVAAIGLAGENRVFQASIEHANSSASRGVGVVMGDKRLKAIAVRGSRDMAVARPAELFEICNRQYGDVYDNPRCGDVFLKEDDDSWHVSHLGWSNAPKGFWSEETAKEMAVRVERDHMSYQWENYSQEMEEVHETIVEKSEVVRGTGCFNCPKSCHLVVSLPGERIYFLKNYSRLAYAKAAYPDLKLTYDHLAAMQNYGLDEFAMPQVLDFVATLYQAGILTDADLPDFPADSSGRILYLLEKIARRDGVGDALADGLYQAARRIGKGAEAYERSAKKIEQLPVKLKDASYPYFLMYVVGDKMNITQIEGSFPQNLKSGSWSGSRASSSLLKRRSISSTGMRRCILLTRPWASVRFSPHSGGSTEAIPPITSIICRSTSPWPPGRNWTRRGWRRLRGEPVSLSVPSMSGEACEERTRTCRRNSGRTGIPSWSSSTLTPTMPSRGGLLKGSRPGRRWSARDWTT